MDGVVATRAGWIGGSEVVEVRFDPKVLPRAELERRGREGCAERAFPSDSQIRTAEDQKYYLGKSALRSVPMTPAQAARIHAALAQGADAERWLSPRQRAAAAMVRAAPDADWPDAIGVPLAEAWEKLRARADALRAE